MFFLSAPLREIVLTREMFEVERIIDLNADLGEGAGYDAELMALVSSANVCCGAHAGDPVLIRKTLELALKHNVVVGAHPGYPDRENFGRLELKLSPADVRTHCQYQSGALDAVARLVGVRVKYLKPHGALYNQACREPDLAKAIVAVALLSGTAIVGLPNSELAHAAAKLNVPFFAEGFADRRYRSDGSLVPRTEPGAFVESPAEAVEQVERLVNDSVRTICIHGDNPDSVVFAQAVREGLLTRGFTIRPFA